MAGKRFVVSGGLFERDYFLTTKYLYYSTLHKLLGLLLLLCFLYFCCLAISLFFAIRKFLHDLHISLLVCHCTYSAIQLSSCKCV